MTSFSHDHQHCDHLLGALEAAVDANDWDAALPAWTAFRDALQRHLQVEELELFPELESDPSTAGPVGVMCLEHQEMRELLGDLDVAIAARSVPDGLGVIDTLLTLIQQHNIKEESVLYALADDLVEPRRAQSIAAAINQNQNRGQTTISPPADTR